MYLDSHCHLTNDRFDEDRDSVILRAREAGVTPVLTVASNLDDSKLTRDLAHDHEDVYASVGVHPHEAGEYGAVVLGELLRLSGETRVVAIGEIGLDYHYMTAPKEVQLGAFREQARVAVQVDRPIIVHSRDAEQDTITVISEVSAGGGLRGVLHCFTGSADMARRALDLGFYISFSGIVTFPKSEALREVAREVPSDRILAETDSPYLAPPPHRGKRNEPSFVTEVYRCLAETRGVELEDLAGQVRINFENLFLR